MYSAEAEFVPGDVLNQRYKLQQPLSHHSERSTWLAEDLETQTPVAVKIVALDADFDWTTLKYFEREVETLKRLDYPGIPRYIDSFSCHDSQVRVLALVQTWIPGQTLAEKLTTGHTFSEAEVKQLAQEALEILQYLQTQNPPVIHRDIKPSNLILGDRLYLVDFGSAWSAVAGEDSTFTVVGTYGYMSPEQFGGRVVPASDLYSLGATLIHLVTGIHPAELPQKDLKIQFKTASNLTPDFAGWLEWMTEPSLEKRLNSPSIALKALHEYKLPHSPQDESISKSRQSLNLFWQGFIFALLRDIFWACLLVLIPLWFLNLLHHQLGWILAGISFLGIFTIFHADWWKEIKTKIIQGLDEHNFLPTVPDEFPTLEIYKLNQYTESLTDLGFVHLIDYTLEPKGRDSQKLGFCRLFYHPQESCFADVFQTCLPHQDPLPMFCSLVTFIEQDWTLATTNSEPISFSQLWRCPRSLWTYIKQGQPEELLRSHLSQRREILNNLGLRIIPESSEGFYFAQQQLADQKRKQRVQKRNIILGLIDITRFENNPESQWLGDYPTMAARRR